MVENLEISFEKFTTNTQIRLLEEKEKAEESRETLNAADLLGDAVGVIETLLRKAHEQDQTVQHWIEIARAQDLANTELRRKIEQLEKASEEKTEVISEVRRKLFEIQ